jgi:pyruvate/2-oxoglutarate dehydrogenase complex dihydrolipoamide acyltransferase (E2) component
MTAVKMPQLGETVIEGTILKWLKQEGEQVALDEPLFEISTDKVDTEVPSSAAGTLTKILVPEGETVAVGTELARSPKVGRVLPELRELRRSPLRRAPEEPRPRLRTRGRRCSLRSGTTRCHGSVARRPRPRGRFGGGGAVSDGGFDADRAAGSWASVADPLAARS